MSATNLWTDAAHASAYLEKRASIPQRDAGMEALEEWVPATARRVLDLGTGDGAVLALVLDQCPQATGLAVDFSPLMLDAARARFSGGGRVEIVLHDLAVPLPAPRPGGLRFRHPPPRPRPQAGTLRRGLRPTRTGWRLPQPRACGVAHRGAAHGFLTRVGMDPADDDPSNQLLDVETQLRWLHELGYGEVDCHWKWRELALLAGARRPA